MFVRPEITSGPGRIDPTKRNCRFCGKEFTTTVQNGYYCSDGHKQAQQMLKQRRRREDAKRK